MDFFIIYDVATGEELMRGSGPEGTARLQSLTGTRGVVQVSFDEFSENIALTDLNPEGLRTSLAEYIKIICSQMLTRGAQTDWGVVDSDVQSILNLQMKTGAAMYLKSIGDQTPMQFNLKDNTEISLTPTLMMAFVGQAMNYLDGIHRYAQTLKQALDACETVDEILSVDVFRGWPAIQ